jgi:transcriptional regulator with XRE-family HTH domain
MQEKRCKMSLSKRIRALRLAKGWGPDDLATRANLSRTALYNLERERTKQPHAATLRQIASALDVPIDTLLSDTPQGQREAPPPRPRPADDPRLPPLTAERLWEVEGKFLELLATPLAAGLASIIEETYRLLPLASTLSGSIQQKPATDDEHEF